MREETFHELNAETQNSYIEDFLHDNPDFENDGTVVVASDEFAEYMGFNNSIHDLEDLRDRLGEEKAILYLRNRFQERIDPDGTWGDAMYLFGAYGGDEDEVVRDFLFVEANDDVAQYVRA
jgi:hypothetical protein